MPRKTKKQKILARLRRLEQAADTQSSTEEIISPRNISIKEESPTNTKVNYDYSYVYKDIRKILILSSIALSIEIALSLTA